MECARGASSVSSLQRRKLDLNAKLESGSLCFCFQALSSRRFKRGFDRVNLHCPTSSSMSSSSGTPLNGSFNGLALNALYSSLVAGVYTCPLFSSL